MLSVVKDLEVSMRTHVDRPSRQRSSLDLIPEPDLIRAALVRKQSETNLLRRLLRLSLRSYRERDGSAGLAVPQASTAGKASGP